METLFENNDFILKSTSHGYDFVGIIETKTDKPLTFFFVEELRPISEDDDTEWVVDESETELLFVHETYESEEKTDEVAFSKGATSWFTTRYDRSTGFLSDPSGRGHFLALIKAYCPEKLSRISWA